MFRRGAICKAEDGAIEVQGQGESIEQKSIGSQV